MAETKASMREAKTTRPRDAAKTVRQVNVALPQNKMLMVDRILAMRGMTLVQYFDKLVGEDILEEQNALREYFTEEEERARRAHEDAQNALAQLLGK